MSVSMLLTNVNDLYVYMFYKRVNVTHNASFAIR